MDVEKFSCKKCSFVSERLEELNRHIESNHSNHDPSDKKQEPNSLTGLYTEDAFHQTLDALESGNPPVKVKFVLAAVISEAPKTKRGRKKAGKDSIGFSIVDMRKFPSWQSTLSSEDHLDNLHYRQTTGQKLYTTYKLNEMFIFSTKNFVFCFDAIKEIRNNLWIILYHIFENWKSPRDLREIVWCEMKLWNFALLFLCRWE